MEKDLLLRGFEPTTLTFASQHLKNLVLQNQMSYDLETWHVALVTQVLQSVNK